jgi:hypothetical protein
LEGGFGDALEFADGDQAAGLQEAERGRWHAIEMLQR